MPANINLNPEIALGVKQADPMTNLSSMLNTANAAQEFQQAQQVNPLILKRQQQLTEQGGYTTQRSAQENQERIATQQFMSNPENWQTNGRIDIDKVNSALPKIAPLTGDSTISRLTTLGEAQTKGIKAKENLTTEQRAIIAGPMGILGRMNVNEPKVYIKELETLKKQNPQNKDLHQLIDSQIEIIKDMPAGQHISQAALRSSEALLSPSEQEAQFAKKSGTVSTGGSVVPTISTPSIAGSEPNIQVGGGKPIAMTLPPGQRMAATGRLDTNNNPTAYVYDDQGNILYETTIQGGGNQNVAPKNGVAPANNANVSAAPARLRAGETQETLAQANQIRSNASNAAATVQQQQFNNNQIIKLADQVATGTGAQAIANLGGGYAGLPFSSDNASNLNQLGHYMSLQTAALANSSGLGGTDAGRSIAGQMAGTTEWTAPAIKATARINRALSTATDLFNRGVQNSVNKSKDPFSARDFQNKWSQVADMNSIRLYDAMKNNDKEAIKEVVDSVGGPNSQGYKKMLQNIKYMNTLIKGQ